MTVDFVEAFQGSYSDIDPETSIKYARSFLDDIARIAGRSDCKRLTSGVIPLDNPHAKLGTPQSQTLMSISRLTKIFFLLPPPLPLDPNKLVGRFTSRTVVGPLLNLVAGTRRRSTLTLLSSTSTPSRLTPGLNIGESRTGAFAP